MGQLQERINPPRRIRDSHLVAGHLTCGDDLNGNPHQPRSSRTSYATTRAFAEQSPEGDLPPAVRPPLESTSNDLKPRTLVGEEPSM